MGRIDNPSYFTDTRLQLHMPCSGDTKRLLLAIGLVGVIWLVGLPWLAARPAMEARIKWLDERGIDPSAMYYTELEAVKPILERLERRRK